MTTASGQAVNDNSGGEVGRMRRLRRWRPSPMTMGIAGFLALISLGVMLLVLRGFLVGSWPPKDTSNSATIADTWHRIRTATPMAQRTAQLKIEKLGPPRKEGDNIIVRLRVTNMLQQSAALHGTPTPGAATPTPAPANIYNATITVIFYNVVNGKQTIVGSGIGNVVNLPYGQSKEIEVVATAVSDFSEATQYEAFADSVWTDKDPIKAAETSNEPTAVVVTPVPTPEPQ